MVTFMKYAWYLVTVAGSILFIPFNLSFFSIWELLKIWPFVLTFFEVIALILLGINVPNMLVQLRSYFVMEVIFKKEKNNDCQQ